MVWSQVLACFFSGVFSANFVPHFVSGVLGRTFPTPFGSPPFRGPSSPRVNVLYGMTNLVVAWVLLRAGELELRSALHAGAFGLGLAAMALFITRSLARIDSEGQRGTQ